MPKQETTIDNNGVNIHCLIFNQNDSEIPLLIIPGATNSAEHIEEDFEGKISRYHIVLSLRGRGKSDSPDTGYSFEEQASDVMAVVKYLKLDTFHLFAYSMGVPMAIRTATEMPTAVKSIILGDYPPIYAPVPKEWPAMVKKHQPELSDVFLNGMVNDGEFVNLSPELKEIKCPKLLVKGGKQGSHVPDEILPKLKSSFPNLKIEILEESNHDLFSPSVDKLVNSILNFIK